MTADEVRLRLMETLDDLLLSFRRQLDDTDPTAVVPVLSILKATALGVFPSRYDRGVIFGLDICRLNDVVGYGSMMPSGLTPWALPDGMFPTDWVVGIGSLYDGQKMVNIWGTTGASYVHRITLPTTLRGANCYVMGAVVYNCTSGTFSSKLLGGNQPAIKIEKSSISLEDIQRAALRENPQDEGFKLQPLANEIIIGRFLVDVDVASDEDLSFTIHVCNDRRRYPLPGGLPCEQYADLAVLIQSAIRLVDISTFDTTVVYDMMLEICDAATWGTSFYDYWTTPGRSLPTNVKFYYNELFGDPDIS